MVSKKRRFSWFYGLNFTFFKLFYVGFGSGKIKKIRIFCKIFEKSKKFRFFYFLKKLFEISLLK